LTTDQVRALEARFTQCSFPADLIAADEQLARRANGSLVRMPFANRQAALAQRLGEINEQTSFKAKQRPKPPWVEESHRRQRQSREAYERVKQQYKNGGA